MQAPQIPIDEKKRLRELTTLCILDTLPEERFDRITRLAARFLRVPMALVSLVDSRVQWFKASHGLSVSESPRTISFCAEELATLTDVTGTQVLGLGCPHPVASSANAATRRMPTADLRMTLQRGQRDSTRSRSVCRHPR